MNYRARVVVEEGVRLVEFPDCPGCQTEVEKDQNLEAVSREALEGWIEAVLQEREIPPHPKYRGKGIDVSVSSGLGLKVELRWARQAAGFTQGEVARRAGVSQQMIAKLEHPDYNPGWELVSKVLAALGAQIEIKGPKPKRRTTSHASV